MGIIKFLKTGDVCTGDVVEKSVSSISSALSKKEPHECCDIVSSPDMKHLKDHMCCYIRSLPDMKHLKDHIMLDFEKDVDILITETGEIELDNDDKNIEL